MLTPLHVKSDRSFGLGTASVAELVAHAARAGFASLALTDVETLSGAVEHQLLCRAAGLHPITGLELRPGEGERRSAGGAGRLVLLVRDRAGYATLCRLVARRRAGPASTGAEAPARSVQACGAEGLWLLSDDPAVVAELLAGGAPRDAVRLLLARPGDQAHDQATRHAARALGVPLVADPDAAMLEAADLPLHRLLVAIQRRAAVRTVQATARPLGTPDALAALFADVPDAVREAAAVAEGCRFDLRDAAPPRPRGPLEPGRAPGPELVRRCRDALAAARRAGRLRGPAHDDRLAAELATIERLELAGYALVVAELLEGARSLGIAAAGRGSAVSSLVLHLLGLSPIDPVAAGLDFERFLHPRRELLPDVDVDVDAGRRDELLAWASRRFGRERTCMVSTLQTFGRRAAWREGLTALGVDRREVDRFCRRLPPDELAPDEAPPPPLQLLAPAVRDHAPLIARLVGRPRHLGTHPAGLIVADEPLAGLVPLERTPKGVVASQYDLRAAAALGLLEIDLLDNRHLAQAGRAAALRASASFGSPATGSPSAFLGSPALRLDDAATLAALRRADTIGCHQVETPALRSVLRRARVATFDDLVGALAIVRPGAAAGQAKEAWVLRARGEAPPEPVVPELAARLAGSRGLLLFEEDVTRALAAAGGLPLEEADRLRAAIADAGEDEAALRPLEAALLEAAARAGRDPERARAAWREVVRFAACSFDKAHATSQALLAFESVFLSVHDPVEHGCALLDHYGGAYPLRTIGAALVRRGVALLPPSVDRSAALCVPESIPAQRRHDDDGGRVDPPALPARAIRLGLLRVKHLRRSTVEALLQARTRGGPFLDVADLLRRVPLQRRELEALVRVGGCDHLAPLRPEDYPFAHEALLAARRGPGTPVTEGVAFDADLADQPPPDEPAARARWELYRALVRARNEVDLLEVHPSAHPLALLREEARAVGCATLADAARARGHVRVAGLVAASRRVATRGGVTRFLTLEDETGLLEVVLPPAVEARHRDAIETPGPYLVDGRLVARQDDPHLVARALRPFHERHGS